MWTSIGKVTVTTAGTPVRLYTGNMKCHAIQAQQIRGNTGYMIIGDSGSMNSTTYAHCLAVLAIPSINILPAVSIGISMATNALDVGDYWVTSTIDGEGVLVSVIIL